MSSMANNDPELLLGHVFRFNPQQIKEFSCEMHLYRAAMKTVYTKLEILDEEFRVKYEYNPIHHIESRLKDPESILHKLKRRNLPITLDSIRDDLHDVAGIRVICNYLEDVERMSDLLLNQEDVALIERKDYLSNPKPNGYRSLHIVVEVPVFLSEEIRHVKVEIQIRTIAMDMWASLEHHLRYKADADVSPELRSRLQHCARQLGEVDQEMQDIYTKIKSNGTNWEQCRRFGFQSIV